MDFLNIYIDLRHPKILRREIYFFTGNYFDWPRIDLSPREKSKQLPWSANETFQKPFCSKLLPIIRKSSFYITQEGSSNNFTQFCSMYNVLAPKFFTAIKGCSYFWFFQTNKYSRSIQLDAYQALMTIDTKTNKEDYRKCTYIWDN